MERRQHGREQRVAPGGGPAERVAGWPPEGRTSSNCTAGEPSQAASRAAPTRSAVPESTAAPTPPKIEPGGPSGRYLGADRQLTSYPTYAYTSGMQISSPAASRASASGGSQPYASDGPAAASSASVSVAQTSVCGPASRSPSAKASRVAISDSRAEIACAGVSGRATSPGRDRASTSTSSHVTGSGSMSPKPTLTAIAWHEASTATAHCRPSYSYEA